MSCGLDIITPSPAVMQLGTQGPGWHGCSGVHTHMTNTRITDVEILERRYPVHVRKFMLRPDTGGTGRFKGGDGVLREILFRAPLTLSVLTERRVLQPYGLKGGGPGARGLNLLIRTDGRTINLGPKTAVPIQPGVSMTNRFVYRGQVFVDGREGTATKMDRVDRKRSGSAAAAALFFVRLLLLLA
ncbi:hypothetical protein Zmor_019612 [Zophobas morio]|uniref:Hydantoinase B/oxoprolinase domain-containing protein n=1 Tax=Zophobas morio TaxID=2755281 RepID=A0AA38M913_9CUCU|nr:hypothetical protein Zmor_019612 [Zophobas morio]